MGEIIFSKKFEPHQFVTLNYLTVIGYGKDYVQPSGQRKSTYVVQCVCGIVKTVHTGDLKRIKSCGCKASEIKSLAMTGNTCGLKHRWSTGKYRKEASVRQRMINRCVDVNNKDYPRYGGRRITVCARWLDPVSGWDNFMDDMHGKYFEGGELDRTDNNLGYCPENCDYVTEIEQQNNKRSNVFLSVDDLTLTMAQWSRERDMPHSMIRQRHSAGWTDHECIYGRAK